MLDITGQRFGKLIAIRPSHQCKRRNWIWDCVCDCGNETQASQAKLRIGHKKSCGCLKKPPVPKRGSAHRLWCGHKSILGSLWYRVKSSAKKRGLSFDITKQDAWETLTKQQQRCALSGVELYLAKNCAELRAGLNTASIDRIDSSKGYERGNIQWVHVEINYMKRKMTDKSFTEWCTKVASHAQERS